MQVLTLWNYIVFLEPVEIVFLSLRTCSDSSQSTGSHIHLENREKEVSGDSFGHGVFQADLHGKRKKINLWNNLVDGTKAKAYSADIEMKNRMS